MKDTEIRKCSHDLNQKLLQEYNDIVKVQIPECKFGDYPENLTLVICCRKTDRVLAGATFLAVKVYNDQLVLYVDSIACDQEHKRGGYGSRIIELIKQMTVPRFSSLSTFILTQADSGDEGSNFWDKMGLEASTLANETLEEIKVKKCYHSVTKMLHLSESNSGLSNSNHSIPPLDSDLNPGQIGCGQIKLREEVGSKRKYVFFMLSLCRQIGM